MKRLVTWSLLALFMVAFLAISAPTANAQTPVSFKVYNPTGALSVTQTFAPRLADLNGKTICEMGESWESDRTFPLISSLLQKQFPTIKIVDDTKLPQWTANPDKALVDKVKSLGCQAVIIGNAG